jgi:hypothetical protein
VTTAAATSHSSHTLLITSQSRQNFIELNRIRSRGHPHDVTFLILLQHVTHFIGLPSLLCAVVDNCSFFQKLITCTCTCTALVNASVPAFARSLRRSDTAQLYVVRSKINYFLQMTWLPGCLLALLVLNSSALISYIIYFIGTIY